MSKVTSPGPHRSGTDADLAREIATAIRGIRYGSVEIVIHDSRVVQIERREKVRLADPPPR